MNDIIPNDTCQVDWCTNRRGHRDNHLRVVGVVEPTPWSTVAAVLVTVEAGRDETLPLPVVTMAGNGESGRVVKLSARLAWREAGELAGLLGQAALRHAGGEVIAEVSTDYSHDDFQRALVRIGASGALEMTGTCVVVEHDTMDETLRVHAPQRTELDRVREIVRVAALQLGILH